MSGAPGLTYEQAMLTQIWGNMALEEIGELPVINAFFQGPTWNVGLTRGSEREIEIRHKAAALALSRIHPDRMCRCKAHTSSGGCGFVTMAEAVMGKVCHKAR